VEKVERKNRVVRINGQEIEVPEGYEVVVEGERIRVVPKEKKEPMKVVQAGTDIPEATVRELKSVGLEFDEEKMKENIATIERADFFVSLWSSYIFGLIFLGAGLLAIFLSYMFFKRGDFFSLIVFAPMGILFTFGGIYTLWNADMVSEALGKEKEKKTPN